MFNHYYFNIYSDSKGNHEIHTKDCVFLPSVLNREYIGYYSSCQAAMKAARSKYPNKKFDGCYFCCNECHRG